MSIVRGKRLIGFLDILGFSKRIEDENIEDLYKLFKALINEADSKVFNTQGVTPNGQIKDNKNFFLSEFMSDSIVLVSNELVGPNDTVKFIFGCIHLMEIAFSLNFPLRGTIGYGDVLLDLDNKIMLSKQFPPLVKCETIQDWSGCFLFDSETEEIVLKAIYGDNWKAPQTKRSSPLIPYNVPVKVKNDLFNKPKLCLNWVHLIGQDDLNTGLEFLKGTKKVETQKFIDIVSSLIDDSSPLGPEHHPAILMRTMMSRVQMRSSFQDTNGNQADPGADVELVFQQPGDTTQHKMILYKHIPGQKLRFKSWSEKFLKSQKIQ